MNHQKIQTEIYRILRNQFEIEDPGLDEDLQEVHGFDSIDAIELLIELEKILQINLDQETKKDAMLHIRTVNQISDYVLQFTASQNTTESSALNK